ncbi:HAD-IA family hydrolase [Paraburkholderia sp. Ac-20340]|uniref:HAD family hydrolase n=1 Tax=Paraburkholderia sp. Ac-20340 TaxID=2703888 RepID=UPI00197DB4A4|nr:HAD-IA family hydrolase [Paraburkholderia sp. Ac-20340]MBN3851809.1 HAD-IA family hydrolase [Paraburkholderia sp. Ac-20340]
MESRHFKAIMFDFDLTLADSSTGIVECTRYALRTMGVTEVEYANIHSVIGLSLQAMFQTLTGNGEIERAEEFARLFVERADEVMVPSTKIYREVPGLFEKLRGHGIKVAIVSNKFRYRIESILDAARLRPLVDVIVGGEDVHRHKPHPDAIALALTHLRVPAASAMYVGDHAVDADAARAAGVSFIGVLSGAMSGEQWSARGERCVKEHIGEVAQLVHTTEGIRV